MKEKGKERAKEGKGKERLCRQLWLWLGMCLDPREINGRLQGKETKGIEAVVLHSQYNTTHI